MALTPVSLLSLREVLAITSASPLLVERRLQRARLEPLYPGGPHGGVRYFVAEDVASALADLRFVELARAQGLAVRSPERTVFGHPELHPRWDHEKNELVPWRVGRQSTLRVHWRCDEGPDHRWERQPARSLSHGKWVGCPFCAGRRVSVTNSLARVHPQAARTWHPTKNGFRTPETVVAHESRVAWWRCTDDPRHVWRDRVGARVRALGCPICSRHRLDVTNSLASVRPDIAALWDQARNEKRPDEIVVTSGLRAFWRCPRGAGHAWRTAVKNLTQDRSGCPFCSGKRATPATSLAALHPALAAEWHPTKNGKLRPDQVRPGSAKRVWWRCKADARHVFFAQVNSRTHAGVAGDYRDRACPYCSGRLADAKTSFAATHPALAREWHPTKNGSLRPRDVLAGSNVWVVWKCKHGHEWPARLRTRSGPAKAGCPYCSGRLVAPERSLAVVLPALAAQWHPTKNAPLTPADVSAVSGKTIWWRCTKHARHVWKATVGYRIRRSDPAACPYCAGTR